MLKLLTRFFIPNSENVHQPKVRSAYGVLCGVYGIFLNLLLFIGKYFAGILSGSMAITADAFNNLSDAGSSLISLLGFVLASKKPDLDHPYGHGRIEYLAGLGLSVVIIIMGVELGKSSVEKIITPQAVQPGLLPAVILFASIAVKLYMSMYNKKIGKKINSAAMQAAATDSLSDSVATAVVLLSMGLNWLFNINIDGYTGLLVAAFIIFAGFNAARDTLSPLLGKAPDAELVQSIEDIVLSHPEVVGIHDLIVHDYGPGRIMASLHAEVDGSGNIFHLHDAIDSAEMEIKKTCGCLVSIHMDPIEADDTEVSHMRHAVAEKLQELDPVISIHDFRMVPGPTHTNLIFDAVVPAAYKSSDEALAKQIRELINSTWPERYAVVNIDRSYL